MAFLLLLAACLRLLIGCFMPDLDVYYSNHHKYLYQFRY